MDAAEATRQARRLVPVLDAMGLEVTEVAHGRASARIPLAPNVNHFGVVYAGSLFSLAEMLGGVLALASFTVDGCVPLVRRVEIDFRRPARTDVHATATMTDDDIARVEAEARRHGRGDYALAVDVTDSAGEVVASILGHYQLRRL